VLIRPCKSRWRRMKFGLFFDFEVEQGAYDKVTQLYDDIIATPAGSSFCRHSSKRIRGSATHRLRRVPSRRRAAVAQGNNGGCFYAV
jgi:hypothetical protein